MTRSGPALAAHLCPPCSWACSSWRSPGACWRCPARPAHSLAAPWPSPRGLDTSAVIAIVMVTSYGISPVIGLLVKGLSPTAVA